MNKVAFRNTIAALAVVAFLSAGATAQKEPELKTQNTPSVLKMRDPFINQNLRPQTPDGTRPTVLPVTPQTNLAPQPGESTSEQGLVGQETFEVPAPEVTITGIVESATGRQAIVNAGDVSQIVSVGQRLADYQVTAISARSVTFQYANSSFEIDLASEF